MRIHWPAQLIQHALDWQLPALARTFAGVYHRCARQGPPPALATGSAIIVANHPSHADAAFLMAALGRRIHFLQAREQYDIAVMRHIFDLIGCIPVSRGRPDPSAIRLALKRLAEGSVVGIFPEGQVTRSGELPLQAGRTGAALLALRSGAPILPAWIEGGTPRGILADWIQPAGGVRVTFGPPMTLGEHRGQPITRARLRAVTDLLMQRIEALRPHPLQHGRAADSN